MQNLVHKIDGHIVIKFAWLGKYQPLQATLNSCTGTTKAATAHSRAHSMAENFSRRLLATVVEAFWFKAADVRLTVLEVLV